MEVKLSRQIDGGLPVHHLLYDAVFTSLSIGPIPSEIAKLGNLTNLYLNDNQLAGQYFFIFIANPSLRCRAVFGHERLIFWYRPHYLFCPQCNFLNYFARAFLMNP
jgi:hypothetical protein